MKFISPRYVPGPKKPRIFVNTARDAKKYFTPERLEIVNFMKIGYSIDRNADGVTGHYISFAVSNKADAQAQDRYYLHVAGPALSHVVERMGVQDEALKEGLTMLRSFVEKKHWPVRKPKSPALAA